ncbi:FecR domain-containing protein [Oceanimonas baumannii]|uniref:FecR domain-containing protein n=1 Tax=Oceanimonas baumannii TaxID=129578 RepID=UPI001D17E1AB|nr:FecR domain-containing protein [Oceanimonas baumannii]MCC4264477.1 FecR domain-containing protein [Oceanimonas baumannii]
MSAYPPIDAELKAAICNAARWHVRLQCSDVTPEEHEQWQRWLAQHTLHRQAWQQMQQLQSELSGIPGNIASPVLQGTELTRREWLRRLGLVAIAVPAGGLLWQLGTRLHPPAHYVTATGEQRRLTLADGTGLVLNTATRADVYYTAQQRLITLYEGEIWLQTTPDPQQPPRPLWVNTPQGSVEPLGTRFTVRAEQDHTRVQVLQQQVRVRPASSTESQILSQGQQVHFSRHGIAPVLNITSTADAWLGGSMAVVNMPLHTLLAELSRYRRGLLSCSRDIAHLEISGAFQVHNTDQALLAITRSFPVKQRRISRYWVHLVPRG